VTDVESVGSSGTTGGLVASGERETRGGAAKPAIRLLTAAAVGAGASLCGCGLDVAACASVTSCGLVATSLPVFPVSTHGRQKRPPIMRGTSVPPQDTHAIFLDTEPGFGWDNRFRFGGCAPGEDSVDDPVRLGAALRLAELRSPWAGLIDFIEYGAAAARNFVRKSPSGSWC